MAQSYSNYGGTGNRTAFITVTTTAAISGGVIADLINGTQANSLWFTNGQTTKEVKLDFGVPRLITEAMWYQDSVATHGTWQWQGSPDNSAWTSIGSTFTLGSPATQTITTLSGNATFYRYYRMLQTGGTISSGPFLREIEFSIDDTVTAPSPAAGFTEWSSTNKTAGITLSNFNLTATANASTTNWVKAVSVKATGAGKFYWEVWPTAWVSGNTAHGFCPSALSNPNASSYSGVCAIARTGAIWVDGSSTGTTLTGVTPGTSKFSIALDLVGKLVWFRVAPSGNWNNSGTANPATGAGGVDVSAITGIDAVPVAMTGTISDAVDANFGGFAFSGAVPSGFATGWTAAAVPSTQGPRVMVLA